MKNGNVYKLVSPLDLVTVSYILLSGIYVCFAKGDLTWLLPHMIIRCGMLFAIAGLMMLHNRFPESKTVTFVKSLYPLLFLTFFYTETSCMKNVIFSNNLDGYFMDAEQRLWHCQPSIEFSRLMDQGWFSELMNLCYFSYYAMTGAICITLYFTEDDRAQKNIFLIVFSFYLYYVLFAVFPVVGPQYYFHELNPHTIPPHFFGKLMHHIITNIEQPTGAFPSSHVGIAIIFSYVTFNAHRKLFFITLPFVIGICFATVYLKEHYLVDVFGGILSAPIFITVSSKVYHKLLAVTGYRKDETVTVS